MSTQPDERPDDGPTPEQRAAASPARVRRAPRFGRFIWSGVVVGLLAALALALVLRPQQDDVSGGIVVWLAVALGLVGALVGAVVAVVADRRTR